MYLVLVGVLLIVLNLADIGPIGNWNWNLTGDFWKFCVPFLLALAWWTWTDRSGLDKRREIEKMEAKKRARREENLVALGMDKRDKRNKRRR